jgi:pyruvyltransferase
MRNTLFFLLIAIIGNSSHLPAEIQQGLPLCYWHRKKAENFGDYLSLKLVERIVGRPVVPAITKKEMEKPKLLAIGSILILANEGDVVWGTGMNGKRMDLSLYNFDHVDVRAVRGPLTRDFLNSNFNINCPEVYGDPALLVPYLFPEFKRKTNPEHEYIIIPHYTEEFLFPKCLFPNAVYPTEPWDQVIKKILNSKFVISSSLHGLVIAEAYGIPARYLRLSDNEPLYKYKDYYLGTNRSHFDYATSVEEALEMGGEPPQACDLEKLYNSFPFDCWPHPSPKDIIFN